jgi:glyoxylase-like metal-dependent hydrolase (beta-lactamase superfamily II)
MPSKRRFASTPAGSFGLAGAFAVSVLAVLAVAAPKPSPPRAKPPASVADLAPRLDLTLKRAPTPDAGHQIEAIYEGVVEYEAHYRRPGEKRSYRSRRRYVEDGSGSVRMDWTTWDPTDTTTASESWLLTSGKLLHRDPPDRPWREVTPDLRDIGLEQTLAGFPWEFARSIRAALRSGTARASGGTNGLWNVAGGRSPASSALTVRPSDASIASYLTNRPHPRLGDVRDGVVYVYGDSLRVPTEIREVAHERDHQWAVTERRISFRTDLAEDSLLAMPAAIQPAAPADSMRAEPRLTQVAPGLWTVDMEDLDTRSMVVEFADKLAVIEAAVGSANGERIIDVVKRRWPGKPIRYLFFSHYHPHYAGGLRAFVAEGATIVTTTGNEAFVHQAAQWPFRLRPDRLAKAPRPVQLRTFKKRFELADSANRLVAVDIGARSDHTDEFVVFWFPNQRVVFETEQGWVTVDGNVRAARRAEKFLKTLDEEGLTSDRLVQSWPMRGNRAEVARAELDSLVVARKK